jgi:hypothetical protein
MRNKLKSVNIYGRGVKERRKNFSHSVSPEGKNKQIHTHIQPQPQPQPLSTGGCAKRVETIYIVTSSAIWEIFYVN